MKRDKRGQASMEFLMTYGWAILAAVLAIGVLAYYGVFSPGRSLPNVCVLNAPLGCDEFEVTASTDIIRIIVRNGAGETINANFTISNCASLDNTGASYTLADGATQDLSFDCSTGSSRDILDGEKINEDINVTYIRSGKTIPETVTGDIRAEAKA